MFEQFNHHIVPTRSQVNKFNASNDTGTNYKVPIHYMSTIILLLKYIILYFTVLLLLLSTLLF